MKVTPELITSFQGFIEGPLRPLLELHYLGHMNTYDRFRERIGPHCAFCKSAAKYMLLAEISRGGNDFLSRLDSGDFTNYV